LEKGTILVFTYKTYELYCSTHDRRPRSAGLTIVANVEIATSPAFSGASRFLWEIWSLLYARVNITI